MRSREENRAHKEQLEAIQSASVHRRRSRRSTPSADRPIVDLCLACGRGTQAGQATSHDENSDVTDFESAHARRLEESASPTDPPPHVYRLAKTPPLPTEEEEVEEFLAGKDDRASAEPSGGSGGNLKHVRLFDQDPHQEDLFGMHKPLWM